MSKTTTSESKCNRKTLLQSAQWKSSRPVGGALNPQRVPPNGMLCYIKTRIIVELNREYNNIHS